MLNVFRFPALALLVLALQAPERASLEGVVTKAGSNEPVPRATIAVTMIQGQLSDLQTATTDDNGRFTVRNLAPGSHRVFVTRDGFVRAEFGQRGTRPGTPVDLLAGEAKRNINISLTQMGVISGRVVDTDGKPLHGAFVRASRGTYNQGELSLSSVQRLQTNDLGEFRFFNLEPGSYYIQALPTYAPFVEGNTYVIPSTTSPDSLAGEPDTRLSLSEALAQGVVSAAAFSNETYLTVYYPGTTDQAAALPIELKPGASFSGLELRAVKTRTVHVRGRVISSVTGQTDPTFMVSLSLPYYGTDQRGGSARNADGTFDFRVPSGKYVLGGQKARMSTQERDMYARMTIEVGDKDIEGITLSLNPSFSLSGKLTIEGRPTGIADPDYGRALFTLTGLGIPSGLLNSTTGNFTYPTVRPGEIRFLLLRPPAGLYYKSARLGSREVLDSGFELNSQPSDTLEIVLSPKAATITVTVVDENQKPVQGATAVVVSDPARRKRQDLNRSATSNAAGQVTFEGLAPGEYKIFAWEEIATGAWQNPETLRTYDSRGQNLRLVESSKENVTLRVIR
jgi:protocatechuate 3,4-dioxygenase beta subunit